MTLVTVLLNPDFCKPFVAGPFSSAVPGRRGVGAGGGAYRRRRKWCWHTGIGEGSTRIDRSVTAGEIGESVGGQGNRPDQPSGIGGLVVVDNDVGESDVARIGERDRKEDIAAEGNGIVHAGFAEAEAWSKGIRTGGRTTGTIRSGVRRGR